MDVHEREHDGDESGALRPPAGSGENPDVDGITEGPGDPDRDGHPAPEDATGSSAHTSEHEGHPDLEGERTARDVGGPTSAEDSEPEPGTEPGGKGDIRTKGFDAHS